MERTERVHPVTAQDLDYCLEVTRQSGSNLWLVGRTLPKKRQAMFVSAYASMRVIDDYVDDTFAVASPTARENMRATAHQEVNSWLSEIQVALKGGDDESTPTTLDRRILAGLADQYATSDIGIAPWGALAQAMHRDIDERPFRTWQDFEEYCEGATVAPASIFLYVLAARWEKSGAQTVNGLPQAAEDCARDMAIFCYLVHIARDLLKDADKGANLITIPDTALAQHGLSKAGLADGSLLGDRSALLGLIVDLIDRATEFRERGEIWRDKIIKILDIRESLALRALMAVYCALHDRLRRDPEIALSRDPAVREQLRRDALVAADVQIQ